MNELRKIVKILKEKKSFLITSHLNHDGDSVGSQIALALFLQQLRKKVVVINESPVPRIYKFLPGAELIKRRFPLHEKFEVAFILDCADFKRTGRVKKFCENLPYKVNIDHHITNQRFGDLNYVDGEISSTGEQIYRIIKLAGGSLNKKIALALYTAIMTDTGSFHHDKTSSRTHRVVADLIKYEISPPEVAKKVYHQKTFTAIKLLGHILSGLETNQQQKVVWMTAKADLFKKLAASEEDIEGLIEIPRQIKKAEVIAFFREDPKSDRIKVTFRSKGRIDVAKIARHFKGGGHSQAAGCLIKGELEEVKRQVLAKINQGKL
jgi:phosphoesterase RecJ-like protein